jgi:hypothetical protein
MRHSLKRDNNLGQLRQMFAGTQIKRNAFPSPVVDGQFAAMNVSVCESPPPLFPPGIRALDSPDFAHHIDLPDQLTILSAVYG